MLPLPPNARISECDYLERGIQKGDSIEQRPIGRTSTQFDWYPSKKRWVSRLIPRAQADPLVRAELQEGEGLTSAATRIQPWYCFDLEISDFRSFRERSFLF